MAVDLTRMLEAAKSSSFRMWVLNRGLAFAIPFNKPHRLTVTEVGDEHVKVLIPFIRKNKNHLGGLHACVLATAAEFASGLVLLHRLGSKNYRLIMKTLDLEYHYQGRMEAEVKFGLSQEYLEKEVIEPLKTEEKVMIRLEVPVVDKAGNHLCTAYPTWQLKRWDAVKTK